MIKKKKKGKKYYQIVHHDSCQDGISCAWHMKLLSHKHLLVV